MILKKVGKLFNYLSRTQSRPIKYNNGTMVTLIIVSYSLEIKIK